MTQAFVGIGILHVVVVVGDGVHEKKWWVSAVKLQSGAFYVYNGSTIARAKRGIDSSRLSFVQQAGSVFLHGSTRACTPVHRVTFSTRLNACVADGHSRIPLLYCRVPRQLIIVL